MTDLATSSRLYVAHIKILSRKWDIVCGYKGILGLSRISTSRDMEILNSARFLQKHKTENAF